MAGVLSASRSNETTVVNALPSRIAVRRRPLHIGCVTSFSRSVGKLVVRAARIFTSLSTLSLANFARTAGSAVPHIAKPEGHAS